MRKVDIFKEDFKSGDLIGCAIFAMADRISVEEKSHGVVFIAAG